MKKTIFAISILFSQSTLAGVLPIWEVPSNYSELETSNGATLYISDNNDYHAIYVDLSKAKLRFDRIIDTGNTNQWGHKLFQKYDQTDFWNMYHSNKTFGFVNGQFFDPTLWKSTSSISFPVKGNNVLFQSNNTESRSLNTILHSGGTYAYKNGYDTSDLNNVSDAFTGWNYSVKKGDDDLSEDQYTHLGVIPNGSCNPGTQTCTLKAVVFLISENKYMSTAVGELNSSWNISNEFITRLDSGGSSQYITLNNDYAESSNPRNMPHMIEILDKWLSTWFDSVKILKISHSRDFFILSQLKFFLRIVYR